jgi:hypothetical protein
MDQVKIAFKSADELQHLGIRAAKRIIDGGEKPNKVILELLKEEEGLSQEHIKRVCEYTNSTLAQTYLRNSNVRTGGFDLVQPTEILSTITTAPEVAKEISRDYISDPKDIFKEAPTKIELSEKDIDSPTYVPLLLQAKNNYENAKTASDILSSRICNTKFDVEEMKMELSDELRKGLIDNELTPMEVKTAANKYPILWNVYKSLINDMTTDGSFMYIEKGAADNISNTLNEEHPITRLLKQITSFQDNISNMSKDLSEIDKFKDSALKKLNEAMVRNI